MPCSWPYASDCACPAHRFRTLRPVARLWRTGGRWSGGLREPVPAGHHPQSGEQRCQAGRSHRWWGMLSIAVQQAMAGTALGCAWPTSSPTSTVPSVTGASMFISATQTLRATWAPPLRQTLATAQCSGSARNPRASKRPWQPQRLGANGNGGRKRRRRCPRNWALAMIAPS